MPDPRKRQKRAAVARERCRERLLAAATRVFAKKGYRLASVSDIIKTAKVARGTFYLYFESKEAIFVALMEAFREKQKALVLRLTQEDAALQNEHVRARARRGVLAWLQFYDQHRDATKLLLREARTINPVLEVKRSEVRCATKEFIASRIRQMQESGVYQKHVTAEMVSHFLTGMLDELIESCLQGNASPDLEWLADQFVEFELMGLLLPARGDRAR